MIDYCKQNIEDDIDRLPWEETFEQLNVEYQNVISNVYGGNQDIVDFLSDTLIEEISYIPPVFGVSPDFEPLTPEFEKIYGELTDVVRRILEEQNVPPEIAKHFHVKRSSISFLRSKNQRRIRCKRKCCDEIIIRYCTI